MQVGDVLILEFQSTPSARRATNLAMPLRLARKTFQSTPSARRATQPDDQAHTVAEISIHALREEGDRSYRRAGVGH